MKKLFFILLLCICTQSCQNIERSPKPDPFFGEEKMSDILVEMYLIEGAQSSNRRSFLQTGIKPDSFIYGKYDIDSLSYQKNLYYYTDRAEEYVELLELVENKLEKIKQDVINEGKRKVEEKRVKDSLRRVEIKKNAQPVDSVILLDKEIIKIDA